MSSTYKKYVTTPFLVVLGWVGLGPNFPTCNGLGWVGSVSSWVGLDRVTQNGPTDNSGPSVCTVPLAYKYQLSLTDPHDKIVL